MTPDADRYARLMKRFLDGELPAPEFQSAYLETFKNDNHEFAEATYDVLDTLFGDVDSFVPDPALRKELQAQNPGFYLDESALRERVTKAFSQLQRTTASS